MHRLDASTLPWRRPAETFLGRVVAKTNFREVEFQFGGHAGRRAGEGDRPLSGSAIVNWTR